MENGARSEEPLAAVPTILVGTGEHLCGHWFQPSEIFQSSDFQRRTHEIRSTPRTSSSLKTPWNRTVNVPSSLPYCRSTDERCERQGRIACLLDSPCMRFALQQHFQSTASASHKLQVTYTVFTSKWTLFRSILVGWTLHSVCCTKRRQN